jgi:mRNA-degrading endonuclease YafQ of YafQ-DinJ toxin-antitoxin module
MNELVWSPGFTREAKKFLNCSPNLKDALMLSFELMEQDIFHPLLHTHKLKGKYVVSWACSIDYCNRIIFDLLKTGNTTDVLLLSIGTHDEVY